MYSDHNFESPTEVHLTVGDFNRHIGNEQEGHITPEETRYIPRRQGDPYPNHQQVTNLRDDTTNMRAKARGRLLLWLLNSTPQIVANGRFENTQNPNFPASLTRTRITDSSNLISRTIVDYMIIGKNHWGEVRSCTVHRGSHLEIGYSPSNPTSEPCDHELLTLSIETPGSPLNTSAHPAGHPDRLRYHTDKLNEKPILDQFQQNLESASIHTFSNMQQTLPQFTAGTSTRRA